MMQKSGKPQETDGRRGDDKEKSSKFRAPNPWPVPTPQKTGGFGGETPKTFGGFFGSTNASGDHSFGGGFGSSTKSSGFGSGFGGEPCETPGFGGRGNSSSVFGSSSFSSAFKFGGSASESAEKDRGSQRSTSEIETKCRHGLTSSGGGGGFTSPTSSSRRARNSTRRPSRRLGRNHGFGHCFHCGEHGHISKACPKKSMNDEDECQSPPFSNVQSQMSKGDENDQMSGHNLHSTNYTHLERKNAETDAITNAKLENLKARESYYSAYSYGVSNGTSSSISQSERTAKAQDVDKFSKELDNALKFGSGGGTKSPSQDSVETTSPRETVVGGGFGRSKTSTPVPETPQHQEIVKSPVRDSSSSETLSIETLRRVMREGEYHYEEQTIISFPRNLPPNVRVIAAQFVPTVSNVVN